MSTNDNSFYAQIKDCKKILILDLGFLGDTIHLIPALWAIRQAMPKVQLDVMVADHIKSILQVTPWVDNILGYPRFPKGPKWYQDFGRIRKLREQKYDAVINFGGSDRSSILTWATGAKFRLGRIPDKQAVFWKYCYTHSVDVPSLKMLLCQRSCECLKKAGFPKADIEFPITIPQAAQEKIESELSTETNYYHVSPFTTLDHKELPPKVLAEFLDMLIENHPKLRMVISCAPNDREKSKLQSLLARMKHKPAKVFPGNLSLMELVALISTSKVHLGGDSGAIHLALMTECPTLSWFRDYPGKIEWLPQGGKHTAVFGEEAPEGIKGITAERLASAFDSVVYK